MPTSPIAILDIGTNTVILLIADLRPDGSFRTLHDEARVVRLGEGINEQKRFLPQAMDRTFAALKEFRGIIDQHGCTRITAIGTAGFRNAQNAQDFIDRVNSELKIAISVITGEHEAKLIYGASKADFTDLKPPVLTVDIGGGSTEFIFDDGEQITARSLSIGSVKLTERFFHNDPPKPVDLIKLDDFLFGELKGLSQALSHVPAAKAGAGTQIIATAGTATTLSALAWKLDVYDPQKVHKSQLKTTELNKMVEYLGKIPTSERRHLPGMTPLRADVIVAGGRLLLAIAQYFQMDSLWISDRGLRYGVLYELLRAN